MSIEKITEIGGFARFTNDSIGFTVCANDSLNLIDSIELRGLYVSLLMRPNEWEIHKTQIASEFNIGQNKIDNYFTQLSRLGLMTITRLKNDKGQFTDTDYRVHLLSVNRHPRAIETMPMETIPMETIPMETIPMDTDGYKVIDNTKLNNKQILSTKVDDTLVDKNFELFWASYPLKDKKKETIKWFAKMKPSMAMMEKIMSGLLRYVAYVKAKRKSNPKFKLEYALPPTWLNGERWETEYQIDQLSEKQKPKHDRCQAEGCGRPAYHVYDEESICDKHMQQIQNKRRN